MTVSDVLSVQRLTVTACAVLLASGRPAWASAPAEEAAEPLVQSHAEAPRGARGSEEDGGEGGEGGEGAERDEGADAAEALAPPDAPPPVAAAESASRPASAAPWSPPPDPLLTDEEVPEWPSSRTRSEREALVSTTGAAGDATLRELAGADPEERALEARRARGWVRAGIVGVVAGSALIAGGLAMRFSDSCAFGAGNNCFTDARDRAAATMAIPGGLILGGGIAMIIVGETQRKRLRVQPAVSRTYLGTTAQLRF